MFVATTRIKLPIWGRFHLRMQGLEGFLWSLIRGIKSVEDRVAAVPSNEEDGACWARERIASESCPSGTPSPVNMAYLAGSVMQSRQTHAYAVWLPKQWCGQTLQDRFPEWCGSGP